MFENIINNMLESHGINLADVIANVQRFAQAAQQISQSLLHLHLNQQKMQRDIDLLKLALKIQEEQTDVLAIQNKTGE